MTVNDQWHNDNGNNTYAVNYPLNENSLVVDLGGCYGNWAAQIIGLYNPYVLLLEPIPDLFNDLHRRFADNPKVRVLNYGIGTESRVDYLHYNGDGTSKYINTQYPQVEINLMPFELLMLSIELLKQHTGWGAGDRINLMQVNIEGAEYEVLEQMIRNKTVDQVDYLQIQFHTFVDNFEQRRTNIQQGLAHSFDKLYDYPFVFEGWKNKTI